MIAAALGVAFLALLALYTWERYQSIIREDAHRLERAALLGGFKAEREAWATERTDLNNRIQVPEAAPFMDEDAEPQFVPFDDDDAQLDALERDLNG